MGVSGVCTVAGCDRPVKVKSRELCSGHYSRWRTTGDVQADVPLREYHDSPTCSVEDCSKAVAAKGFCQAHYKRWKTHSDPLGARVYPTRDTCHIDGCENPSQARGLCKTHWKRWKDHGDPLWDPPVTPKPRTGQCEIEGCERPVSNIGMCTRHANSYRMYGDPLVSRRRRRYNDEIETICTVDGCERPHKKAGYCGAHYVSIVRNGYLSRARKYTILEKFMRRLYESHCTWCGKRGDIHADHVIPLARGGTHCEGNLQPLCADCNKRKNDRLMIEWKWAIRKDAELAAAGIEVSTRRESALRPIRRVQRRVWGARE